MSRNFSPLSSLTSVYEATRSTMIWRRISMVSFVVSSPAYWSRTACLIPMRRHPVILNFSPRISTLRFR